MAINTVVSGGPVDIVTPQVQFVGPDVKVGSPTGSVEIAGPLTVTSASLQLGGANGLLGFFGTAPIAEQTIAAAATDAATTQALANSIRTILLAYGLVKA